MTLTADRNAETGDVRITAAGEIDLTSAPDLTAAFLSARDAGTETITADLRGVSFIDSAGLNACVQGHKRQHDLGGRLRVVVLPGKQPARALHISRFGLMFPVLILGAGADIPE